MEHRDHPSVGRLAFYLIVAAAAAGTISGWAYASGTASWAMDDLRQPGWAIPINVLSWLWIGKTLLMAYALWATERFGRPGWRWLALAGEMALFVSSAGWIVAFLILRDPAYGFLAIAWSWIVTVFTVWFAGRSAKLAGVSLWPVLIWTSYMLVLSFEIMRLNPADMSRLALVPF